jgi:membrane-associated phospholipid phosphatase
MGAVPARRKRELPGGVSARDSTPADRPAASRHAAADVLPRTPESVLSWWREIVLVLYLYVAYEVVRDLVQPSGSRALGDAREVLAIEEWARINVELPVQRAALHYLPLVDLADAFYGTVYALSTVLALVWVYRSAPQSYRLWRNALACTTALGLLGFYLFPLAPPRLLDRLSGGSGFGFVDTVATLPGPWSASSPLLAGVSNPYAAMPSLHCAWALWTACAVWALHPRAGARWAVWLLPAATVVVVVVTGNHFILDVMAGALASGLGIFAAWLIDTSRRRTLRRLQIANAGPDAEPNASEPRFTGSSTVDRRAH